MPALIVDPALIAAVTRQFNLRGELKPFNLTENVVPTFDIGKLTGIDPVPTQVVTPGNALAVRIGTLGGEALEVTFPEHIAPDVFNNSTAAPGANTVLADTGQLSFGVRRMQIRMSHDDAVARHFEIQWRNAANSATIATYPIWVFTSTNTWLNVSIQAVNERVRIVNVTAIAGLALSYIAVAPSNRAQSV